MQEAKPEARRRWWIGVLIAGVLITALTQLRAQPATGEEDTVLARDNALAAARRSGDRTVARKLLSLEFTAIDEDGRVHERKNFLGDLKGGAAEPTSDAKVKIYGLVAMVTGHHRTARGSDAFFLDIWVKQKRAWRALVAQDVVLGTADASSDPAEPPGLREDLASVLDCKNPCETIPYRVRSPAEQDVLTAFQTIEKATYTHDAAEYGKHIADEFMHYRSGSSPLSKSDRMAVIQNQKTNNIPAILTAIHSLHVWVYGDGAAMISTNGIPGDSEPILQIARVWVKRNGQWLMAISVQTDVN